MADQEVLMALTRNRRQHQERLFKRDAQFCVSPPHRMATMAFRLNNKFKMFRNADSCRNPQSCAAIRNIFYRAFQLGRLFANHDEGTFQNVVTRGSALFVHRPFPLALSRRQIDFFDGAR